MSMSGKFPGGDCRDEELRTGEYFYDRKSFSWVGSPPSHAQSVTNHAEVTLPGRDQSCPVTPEPLPSLTQSYPVNRSETISMRTGEYFYDLDTLSWVGTPPVSTQMPDRSKHLGDETVILMSQIPISAPHIGTSAPQHLGDEMVIQSPESITLQSPQHLSEKQLAIDAAVLNYFANVNVNTSTADVNTPTHAGSSDFVSTQSDTLTQAVSDYFSSVLVKSNAAGVKGLMRSTPSNAAVAVSHCVGALGR